MVIKEDISLRAKVFQYFRDHPLEAFSRDNKQLYAAFDAKTKKEQAFLRSYKKDYVEDVTDFWGKKKEKAEKKEKEEKKEEATSPVSKLPEFIDFLPFCRWTSYPKYKGLYWWQEDCWGEIEQAKYAEILVPRDHGKSIFLGDLAQWLIQYGSHDVLYLGWTDRRKEVAENISNFFEVYGEMDDKKSPFHFTTKNGGKFDCYLIKSKDILGMHSKGDEERFDNLTPEEIEEIKEYYDEFNEDSLRTFLNSRNFERKLCIIIDDPIDDSFFKERYKEEELEIRFMSTIYNINPDKWIFTGTKKFRDDFFDFIERTFRELLVQYKRSTHLQPEQNGYDKDIINNPKNLLCPERFTEEGQPNYETDKLSYILNDKGKPLKKNKRIVSKIPKRDLTEIYNSLMNSGRIYWWYAEYEQDPHPIAGEIWDSVDYVDVLDGAVNRTHDVCFITVDRATTTKLSSDFTGCVIGVRHKLTGHRIITHDFTGHINIDELLLKINKFVTHFRAQYETMLIMLIVEKQGGGDDFLRLARSTREFIDEKGNRIPNKIPNLCIIEEIHNTGEKLQRIKDRLIAPLKNQTVKFLSQLKHCELVNEILDFPHSAKLDAIDALANSEFLLLEKYPGNSSGYDPLKEMIQGYERAIKHDMDEKQELEWKLKEERKKQEIMNGMKSFF